MTKGLFVYSAFSIKLFVFLNFHHLLLKIFKKVMNRKNENIWLFLFRKSHFSLKQKKNFIVVQQEKGTTIHTIKDENERVWDRAASSDSTRFKKIKRGEDENFPIPAPFTFDFCFYFYFLFFYIYVLIFIILKLIYFIKNKNIMEFSTDISYLKKIK